MTTDVRWDLNNHRTRRSVAECMKSPAHHVGNLIRLNYDFATFRDTLVSPDRRELGSNRVSIQGWARSKVQDGNVIGECLSDTAPRNSPNRAPPA